MQKASWPIRTFHLSTGTARDGVWLGSENKLEEETCQSISSSITPTSCTGWDGLRARAHPAPASASAQLKLRPIAVGSSGIFELLSSLSEQTQTLQLNQALTEQPLPPTHFLHLFANPEFLPA